MVPDVPNSVETTMGKMAELDLIGCPVPLNPEVVICCAQISQLRQGLFSLSIVFCFIFSHSGTNVMWWYSAIYLKPVNILVNKCFGL